jgi:diketogulonate reductase-like aldo/keto reductase
MLMRGFGPLPREVPAIGQGTWNFPTRGAQVAQAVAALRAGIEAGMTHIDTAEMYGDGRSEEIVGEAIKGLPREDLFIVSKVLPSHASYDGTHSACEQSLRRLGTDYLDVYLLHWRGRYALSETMRAFEALVDAGKIRALGVSNFDVEDLEEACAALRTHPLACNQVMYHLQERGIERRVLPFCRQHRIAVVGYSPLGAGDFPSPNSTRGRLLARIAQHHGATPAQVALAFLVRLEGTFTIPKAATLEHVRENAAAGELRLRDEDVAALEEAFPKPERDGPLAVT